MVHHFDTDDPLTPTPPRALHFDQELRSWILSRYAHVVEAFRAPELWPTSALSEQEPGPEERAAQSHMRAETIAAFSPAQIADWRTVLEPLTERMVAELPGSRDVDLVRDFTEPWSLALAALVTGLDASTVPELSILADDVSAAAREPYDLELKSRAVAANGLLQPKFPDGSHVIGAPLFVALSKTLPCVLANAWAALLNDAAEFTRLRQQPDLLPRAVEELLRYAGIPRTLFRRAIADVELGGMTIRRSERVVLMIDSANRDPAQFNEPNRLDLGRRSTGQLSLGSSPRSCVGGPLIRMALAVATGALIRNVVAARLLRPMEWVGGSGFRSPAALWVSLEKAEPLR